MASLEPFLILPINFVVNINDLMSISTQIILYRFSSGWSLIIVYFLMFCSPLVVCYKVIARSYTESFKRNI